MEVEDFDDEATLTPAQLIARERAALGADAGLNSAVRAVSRAGSRAGSRVGEPPVPFPAPGPSLRNDDFRIPAAGNTAGRENFGLSSEVDGGGGSVGGDSLKLPGPRPAAKLPPTPPRVGAGAGPGGRGMGLEAELQQMGLDDPRPQAGEGFGLQAEVAPGPGPLLPPPRGLGSRTGSPSSSLRGPRTAAGPSPLQRPALPLGTPPRGPGMEGGGFGLAAETATAAPTLAGGLPPPAMPAPAPMTRPAAPPAFGLASELRAGAGQPMQRGPEFGLDRDVQAAVVTGQLPVQPPPPGGFGLEGEMAAAGPLPPAAPGLHHAAAQQFQQQQQQQQYGPPLPQQYGLDTDIARAQGQGPSYGPPYPYGQYGQELDDDDPEYDQQVWQQPFADTFSLEQLPPDQQWLHLSARQAERVMLDLAARGQVPKVVDVRDVREKLLDSTAPPRLAYLAAVEQHALPDHRLPPTCRPSLLQTKLKAGQNRLRTLLTPILEPGSQGFVDLSYGADGGLQPETGRVWQFGLSLVQADAVGKTGLQRVRAPCLFIARMALFDRRANRFLGNVLGVRPRGIGHADKLWEFNPEEQVIVRCGCVQADPQSGTRLVTDDALSVYVEFNTSYRLQVEDTVNMPLSEKKSSQLLDEVTTCWAMISFKKCAVLQREVSISVPLYYGSIYDPKPMDAYYAAQRAKTPIRSAFKSRPNPVLQFRAGPLGAGKPPLVPYAFMPATMLGTHDLGTALAAYRMCLSLSLARGSGPFAPLPDPVLAGFPHLLADHHVLAEFLTKWRDITTKMTAILDVGCCSPDVLPPLAALVEGFRRCAIELIPITHSPSLPQRHINNFVEFQGHRLRVVQRYCHVLDPATNRILGARHPVEPLSHAGFEYLHAPFDVSEVRLCMADRLEKPHAFYKH